MQMLTTAQIKEYGERGYLGLEGILSSSEVQYLQKVTDDFVEQSRSVTEHTEMFDLEPDHTPEFPKLRRLKEPHAVHEVYRRTLRHEGILDIVSQLVGTSAVRFNGTKLNMKSGTFGSPVEWHQDWAFYPHTNDDLLAVGVAIDEMSRENGCLMVIPGSHKGRIYDHHQDGRFAGAVTEPDFDDSSAALIELKAGGISIHHVRTLHASMPNASTKPRRLLLLMYCSGDSFSLHAGPGQIHDWEGYRASFLRGEPSQNIRMENCPLRVPFPPPLHGGSIYETQSVLSESTLKGRYEGTGADWPR